MDYEPYKPRRSTNIDGVFNGHDRLPKPVGLNPQPLPEPQSANPLLPQPNTKPTSNPVNTGQPSLLNTTIPNPRYSQPFGAGISRINKQKKRWSRKRKILSSILVFVLLIVGFSSWYGGQIIGNIDKVFHGNIFSDAQALFSSTELKGESVGRVNILLAGDSADDPGHQGADLTDSIMVLSIDTKNHTAFMLSIPRDLWVYIPGIQSYQKINAANDVTNFNQKGYPKGGMGQLQQIVQTDLGIPIDYSALINYTAFKDAVNAVGGITININSSDPNGLYDSFTHLQLPNGNDKLDGQVALDLARARGDGAAGDVSYGIPDSDFTRTMYQREMLLALADKAKSVGVITNPIKVTGLFDALGNNVQTNLNLQDVLRLIQITKGITNSSVGSDAYSSSLTGSTNSILTDYTDPASGQEAVIPAAGIGDYGQLQQYYLQLTSNNPVIKEGASVVILNGSDVNGLASKERSVLQTKGIDDVSITDANEVHPATMIIDQSNGADPATKTLLEKLFPGTVVTNDTGSSEAEEAYGYPNANFVIVLGQNWDNS
ncbi:MAG: LCP family protein [Candidatus Saccharimonadales bacterium]